MSTTITRSRLVAAATLACAALAPSLSQAGTFEARFRVLDLEPANQSTVLGTDRISINDKYIWEIDGSYFITPNWALELIATTPQKQTLYLDGDKLGTLRHLPPTLTVQYHFAPNNTTVQPYVGLGLNYTRFSNVNLPEGLTIKKHSWGTAFQIGADFPLGNNLYFNVDFKRINISTDVSLEGTKVGKVKVDPVLFGVGIGYRF
jgi:outer membrane protein